jgi:excisionase family DNA binding protein
MGDYTLAEAAVKLGVKHETIRKRLQRNQIAGHKVGPVWMIELPDEAEVPDPVPTNLSLTVQPRDMQQDHASALVEALQARILAQEELIRALLSKVPEAPKQLEAPKKKGLWQRLTGG